MENSSPAQVGVLPRKRIDYYDIAKGIGILLVVWAHARGPFSDYIYKFHMPLFFLISGLLYHGDVPTGKYVWRKVRSLYIPFAFWNVLFYTVKSVIRGSRWQTILRTNCMIVLTLSKDGEFLGATWFLGALFLVSVVYKIMDDLMGKTENRDFVLLVFSGVLTLVAMQVDFPYILSRTVILGLYFAAGVFVKNHRAQFATMDSMGAALGSILIFVLTGYVGSVNMSQNYYRYPMQFICGAFLASYAVLYFCRQLDARANRLAPLKKCLIFLGKHSLDIVIWQFVAFRLVIALQMYLNGEALTVANILSYYPCYSTDGLWWIAYLLVGVLAPVGLCTVLRLGPWGKVLKKLHIV